MGIVDEAVQIVTSRVNKKLFVLKKNAIQNHHSEGGFIGGFIHQGVVITLLESKKLYAKVYELKESLSESTKEAASNYLLELEALNHRKKLLTQLLNVLYIKCGGDDDVFLRNIPPALASRLMEGREDTPPNLLYLEAKTGDLFWEQYQTHVINYVHMEFGLELIY